MMLTKVMRWVDEWLIGDYTPSCAGFLPLVIGGALLAKKFLGGLGKKKQAEEQAAANERDYQARKANWETGQDVRGGRLDAVKGLLSGLTGHLAAGAPSYQFDPAAFEKMKTRIAFGGSLAADPSKGAGYGLASDIAGGVADTAGTYMAGANPEAASGGVQSVGFNPQTYTPFNPRMGGGTQTGGALSLPEMTPDNPFGVRK